MEPLSADEKLRNYRRRQATAMKLSIILLLLIAVITFFSAWFAYTRADARAEKYGMSVHEMVHKETIDLSTVTTEGIEDRQYVYRTYMSFRKNVFLVLISIMAAVSFYGIFKWKRVYQDLCDKLAQAQQ